jgi:hypothetical protein
VLRITFVALALLGCRRTPSAQECAEAFAQLQRIATETKDPNAAELGRGYLDSFKTKFMERCQKDGTRAEVQCIQKSRTLDDLDKCIGEEK